MISDTLFPKLMRRYQAHGVRSESEETPTITIPGKCSDFGDLVIQDDGDEVTIFVGKFTHTHFGCYDEGATEQEKIERIGSEVEKFVEEILADRIVAWGSHAGWGGCHAKKSRRGFWSKLRQEYAWSGKLE